MAPDRPAEGQHAAEVTAERGTMVITGRSDATLNRGGVRMGTSEFYAVVEDVPGVADSLVVHQDDAGGGPGTLWLIVVLDAGADLDDELRRALAAAIRSGLSPRHVPDTVHAISAVPRTISGKKMEVPAKRLLEGEPLEVVANPGAMQDPPPSTRSPQVSCSPAPKPSRADGSRPQRSSWHDYVGHPRRPGTAR